MVKETKSKCYNSVATLKKYWGILKLRLEFLLTSSTLFGLTNSHPRNNLPWEIYHEWKIWFAKLLIPNSGISKIQLLTKSVTNYVNMVVNDEITNVIDVDPDLDHLQGDLRTLHL